MLDEPAPQMRLFLQILQALVLRDRDHDTSVQPADHLRLAGEGLLHDLRELGFGFLYGPHGDHPRTSLKFRPDYIETSNVRPRAAPQGSRKSAPAESHGDRSHSRTGGHAPPRCAADCRER